MVTLRMGNSSHIILFEEKINSAGKCRAVTPPPSGEAVAPMFSLSTLLQGPTIIKITDLSNTGGTFRYYINM